jgi:ERCC4-type nuclease
MLTAETDSASAAASTTAANPFKLPALRKLGDLADIAPTIIVDNREQDPLAFTRLASRLGTLYTGDYSAAGVEYVFAIERKSVADLVGCSMNSNRERFERELHRLRGFRFKRLLVVGSEAEILSGEYHSKIAPKAVLATLQAFEVRYDCPVVYASTATEAARRIEFWAYWFCREVVQEANALLRGANCEEG